MNWTRDDIALLRHLWNERGLPASRIALEMGRSKSSIVGAAHRYGCSKRPSPIKSCPPPQTDKTVPREGPVQVYRLPPNRCQWIEGEPKATDENKCGKPTVRNRHGIMTAWCAEHFAKAYNTGASRLKDEMKKGFLRW